MKDKGSKTASDHLSFGCCQPAHDVCCIFFFRILRVFGSPMGYHDNHWKKIKVTLQKCWIKCLNRFFFNLQRRVIIQYLAYFAKKNAFEVPYNARCCVERNNWNYIDLQCYEIFLQIWKEDWRKHRIQYLTKLAYILVTRCCEQK